MRFNDLFSRISGTASPKFGGKTCNILPSNLMRAGRRAAWASVLRSLVVALIVVRLAVFAPSVFRYAAAKFAASSMESAYAGLLETNARAARELGASTARDGEEFFAKWKSLPTGVRIAEAFYETLGCFADFRLKYAGFAYRSGKLVVRVVLDVRPDDGEETRAAFLSAMERASGMKGATVRSEPVPGSVDGLVVVAEFAVFVRGVEDGGAK